MTRNIQHWMLITHFALYIRKLCHFHPDLEEFTHYLESFQKWRKIGPSFPSTFGTELYNYAVHPWACAYI